MKANSNDITLSELSAFNGMIVLQGVGNGCVKFLGEINKNFKLFSRHEKTNTSPGRVREPCLVFKSYGIDYAGV